MSSVSVYTYVQAGTPTEMATLSTVGPSGAVLNCVPSPTLTISDTFVWYATASGCPVGYSFSSLGETVSTGQTCIWNGVLQYKETFSWSCSFLLSTTALTTVNGGTTTIGDGSGQTITAAPQTVTVTQTVQQTSTSTSTVAPGAQTISVTSTVTGSSPTGAVKRQPEPEPEPEPEVSMPKKEYVLHENFHSPADVDYDYYNASSELFERACNGFQCSKYCCAAGAGTCVGDGAFCCTTYSCVPYDQNAPFRDYNDGYLFYHYTYTVLTSTRFQTTTTYSTVHQASGTVTITPTSTQSVTSTNVQTVTTTITTTAATVTVTVITTVFGSAPPKTPTPPSTTHSPVPKWPGSGNLLNGYCATRDYVLLSGATVLWAPFIGCDETKTDCCPYDVASPVGNYPIAAAATAGTLAHCPDDYQTVSGGCCPSGYNIWTSNLGGQTPCFSSLPSTITPPAIPSSLITATSEPTSTVVNVVYAIYYPVASSSPSSGLSTGAQAGIGAGVGAGALAVIGFLAFFFYRRRNQRRDRDTMETFDQPESAMQPTVPSVVMSPSSPGPTEYYPGLEKQGEIPVVAVAGYGNHVQQQDSSYSPQSDSRYGTQPAYQSWESGQFQQQQQQSQEVYGSPPIAQGPYPSPPTSTGSPPPMSTSGYSAQTGYTNQGQGQELYAGQHHMYQGQELYAGQVTHPQEMQGQGGPPRHELVGQQAGGNVEPPFDPSRGYELSS